MSILSEKIDWIEKQAAENLKFRLQNCEMLSKEANNLLTLHTLLFNYLIFIIQINFYLNRSHMTPSPIQTLTILKSLWVKIAL